MSDQMTDDQLPVGSPMGWTSPEPPPVEPAEPAAGTEFPDPAQPPQAAPSTPGTLAAVEPPVVGEPSDAGPDPLAPGALPPDDSAAAAPGGAIGPDGWTTPTAPPAKRRFGMLIKLIVPAVIVLVVAGGVLFRDRISGNASDIKPGECFDDPISASQSGGEVKDVQHHPCSEPHLFEVIQTFKFPTTGDASFPGDAAFDTFIEEKCPAAFAGYVGIPAAQSTLGYTAYVPGKTGWTKGDRDITCFLGALDGKMLTGSMKDARR